MICFLFGLQLTNASNAGVITATTPLFILIVTFFSGIEKPTVFTILGIAIGFVGALMLGWQGERFAVNTGDMIILLACGLMGAFTVFSKKIVSLYTPMVIAGWIFTFNFLYQLPFFIFKLPAQSWATIPSSTWINFAVSVVGPLYIANALYYYSLRTIGPSRVGVFTYLMPVFTLAFAYFLRHEAITFQKIMGLTVIVAGILVTKKKVYRRPIY
jgi:drug/metabolite transporter (DMT)-like permease